MSASDEILHRLESDDPNVVSEALSEARRAPSRAYLPALSGILRRVSDRAVLAATIQLMRKVEEHDEGGLDSHMFVRADAENGFLMFVLDIFWVKNRGLVATGIVSRGGIRCGDPLELAKADGRNIQTLCREIFFGTELVATAKVRDSVGLLLDRLSMGEISQGDVLRSAPSLVGP